QPAAALVLAGLGAVSIYLSAKRRGDDLRKLNPTLTVHSVFISPNSLLTLFFPSWIPIKLPRNWLYSRKFSTFAEADSGIVAICDSNGTNVFVADPELCREIMTSRYKEFLKPVHVYTLIDIYGKNIVTTEGEEWRKHRKIAAPTFSEQNNALVHEASIQIGYDMFKSWESKLVVGNDGSKGSLVNVSSDMMEFALSVISSAAFVEDPSALKKGHKMTHDYLIGFLIPRALYFLPSKYLQDTWTGFTEFEQYLDAIVEEAEVTDKPKNLLQMLTKAVREEKSEGSLLTKSELKGNSFVFLLAGHETTAGTLTFALGLLALHPTKQEALFTEVKEIVGDSEAPKYSDYSKFKYAMAVLNETLRLFPPVVSIPKYTSTERLSLGPFIFPPRTFINVATAGLHFNPKAWGNDALEFKPERFLQESNEEQVGKGTSRLGFAPFSEGPRGCLGKKFAQVEFVALLVLISLKYRVSVPDGVDRDHFLDAINGGITLKPKDTVHLFFSPR
ncbi:cytochrome P450, partial [Obelidium mucronatum]